MGAAPSERTHGERGFYHHKGDCDKNDFDAATLAAGRVPGD
jgi:hypothetical protein